MMHVTWISKGLQEKLQLREGQADLKCFSASTSELLGVTQDENDRHEYKNKWEDFSKPLFFIFARPHCVFKCCLLISIVKFVRAIHGGGWADQSGGILAAIQGRKEERMMAGKGGDS